MEEMTSILDSSMATEARGSLPAMARGGRRSVLRGKWPKMRHDWLWRAETAMG